MRINQASLAESQPWSELPRTVWRRLLSHPHLSPGARILVVSPKPNSLAEWLASLSFDVVAACEDATHVLEGRRDCPQVEFLRIAPGPRLTLPWHSFDAAFVQPVSAHEGSWLSSTARLFTASVLASLKPQGRLIWWQRQSKSGGHDAACWSRHLGCFPGRVESSEVSNGFFLRKPHASTLLVTMQAPSESLTWEDWRTYARQGLLTDRRGCCAFAEASHEFVVARRAA